MNLSNQAVGAFMMALQKSLLEQSDIVPVLKEMDLVVDDGGTLSVANPPIVSLEGVELADTETLTDSTVLIPED
tara:strand:+ start:42715 stop:42936 length:222 start_codon:yes stop_codon:yes gene_type:complete